MVKIIVRQPLKRKRHDIPGLEYGETKVVTVDDNIRLLLRKGALQKVADYTPGRKGHAER